MRIDGEWYPCMDGVIRPVVHGEVLASDDSWLRAPFLIDTGADRTVLHEDIVLELGSQSDAEAIKLAGVGGFADSAQVATSIRLPVEQGPQAVIGGEFVALAGSAGFDMSVLGRDVTDHFAVIIDRPGNVVCLIRQHHRYVIQRL